MAHRRGFPGVSGLVGEEERGLPACRFCVGGSKTSVLPPHRASDPGLVREGARRQADFGSEVVGKGVGPGGKTPAVEFAPALIM